MSTDAARSKRGLLWGVAVLLAGAGIVAFMALRSGPPPPVSTADAPTPAPAAPPSTTSAAPAPAAAAAAPAVPAAPDTAPIRAALQKRLDAIAAAYDAGDGAAIEDALWPNHAVIRPDGERFERAELLALWHQEWEQLADRDLKFYVEDLDVDGTRATAVWTILLTAEVRSESGDPAHMMISGKQQATFVRTAGGERLDGPIEYVTFERTMNGFPWPLD